MSLVMNLVKNMDVDFYLKLLYVRESVIIRIVWKWWLLNYLVMGCINVMRRNRIGWKNIVMI